ncbi:MAG: CDP-alcohol phosphatidyltransferase family protein [Candidatus Rokubacteria bacterium]|nr:CDP-alcohol phosphatidyltransferase family protein [Candidatus Rokubacteria bacterium]
MSLAAVIYLPDAASRQWVSCAVAGRSVLLRLLLTAVHVGVGEIGLPRGLADESLVSQIRRHPRLSAAVFALEDRALGSGAVLLLPAHTVMDAGSLRKLRDAAQRGITAALEESKGSPAPVMVMSGTDAQLFRDRLVAGAPIAEELELRLRSDRVSLIAGGGYFVPVTDSGSRREAEAALYRSLGTEADSLMDRLINRRCSRWLTRLLVRFPVTPNLVSLVSLALGLAAAWQFWSATPASALLGLLCYLTGVVVDHADGEIARLTFQESALGRWLDLSADTVTHALLVLGIAVTASRIGGTLMLAGGALAACGIFMSALFANLILPRMRPPERLGRALVRLGNRDPFYLVLISFILLLWKAPWALTYLVGVLALGSQAYWLTCLARWKRLAR